MRCGKHYCKMIGNGVTQLMLITEVVFKQFYNLISPQDLGLDFHPN